MGSKFSLCCAIKQVGRKCYPNVTLSLLWSYLLHLLHSVFIMRRQIPQPDQRVSKPHVLLLQLAHFVPGRALVDTGRCVRVLWSDTPLFTHAGPLLPSVFVRVSHYECLSVIVTSFLGLVTQISIFYIWRHYCQPRNGLLEYFF